MVAVEDHRPEPDFAQSRLVAGVLVFEPGRAVQVFEDEMRNAAPGAGAQVGNGGEAGIEVHERSFLAYPGNRKVPFFLVEISWGGPEG